MKKVITLREIFYMFLAVSIGPIVTILPAQLGKGNNTAAFISTLFAIGFIGVLGFFLISIMLAYPHRNFYEILVDLLGVVAAKIVILCYAVWSSAMLVSRLWQYTVNLQTTIMPNTREAIFFVTMILLVLYAFTRGIKTVFRFAEFVLGPILLVLLIYVVSALPNIQFDNIYVMNHLDFSGLCNQALSVLAVAGNFMILLLYWDNVKERSCNKSLLIRFFIASVIIFSLLLVVICTITYGVVGNDAVKTLDAPFYVAMRGISVLNVFEHFEPIVIIITFLSDFLAICLYASMSIRCIKWLFSIRKAPCIYIPYAALIYYFSFILCKTQFDVKVFYMDFIIAFSFIMQYVIPVILFCIYYGKHGFKKE